jgi:hypothetical protein
LVTGHAFQKHLFAHNRTAINVGRGHVLIKPKDASIVHRTTSSPCVVPDEGRGTGEARPGASAETRSEFAR